MTSLDLAGEFFSQSPRYRTKERLQRMAKAMVRYAELSGRIDEYKNHMPCTKYPSHYQVDKAHLDERLADLENQLKEIKL